MIERHRSRLVALVTVLTASGAAAGGPEAVERRALLRSDQRSGAQGAAIVPYPPHDAFGFRIGEERRYALGPDERLRPGEFEVWTLRLEAADSDGRMPLYHFSYSYEYSRPQGENTVRYRGEASVVVNAYGFPLTIEYGPNRYNGVTTGGTGHNGRVAWSNGWFTAQAPQHMQDRRLIVDLPTHAELDPATPKGLFISESDNPALITFPAVLLQTTGATKLDFLVLRPQYIGAFRRVRARGAGGPFPGSGSARRRGFGPRRPRADLSGRRDVARGYLTFQAVEEIEVGGRRYEAIRLSSADTDGDVYIRGDGALLRIDTLRDLRRMHIRLLHPSEY